MSRSARRAAFGALVGLIGCSVYDASLLVGGLGTSGTGAQGNGGGSGTSRGGNGGGTAADGGTSGSRSGATGSGGSNGGSSQNGGSGASGGSSNGGSTGGSSTGGSSMGGTTGGTDTSTGGGNEGGNAGVGDGGAADGGTTSATGGGGSSGGVGGSASGMSGTGGNAGGAGSSGSGAAGTGGVATATGCAVLSAGLGATTDNTHYLITLGTADVNLTNAVIDVHLYAKGTGGGIFLYIQEATYEFWGQPLHPFGDFDGWTTLRWDLSAETSTGTLDKATVRRLGIEITGAGGSAWTNPMLVYVDSITVTTPTLSFAFADATTVTKTPTSLHTGDTALWLNNSSSDTTATGSTLDWVTSCP